MPLMIQDAYEELKVLISNLNSIRDDRNELKVIEKNLKELEILHPNIYKKTQFAPVIKELQQKFNTSDEKSDETNEEKADSQEDTSINDIETQFQVLVDRKEALKENIKKSQKIIDLQKENGPSVINQKLYSTPFASILEPLDLIASSIILSMALAAFSAFVFAVVVPALILITLKDTYRYLTNQIDANKLKDTATSTLYAPGVGVASAVASVSPLIAATTGFFYRSYHTANQFFTKKDNSQELSQEDIEKVIRV